MIEINIGLSVIPNWIVSIKIIGINILKKQIRSIIYRLKVRLKEGRKRKIKV
jgi:hypothetical protein